MKSIKTTLLSCFLLIASFVIVSEFVFTYKTQKSFDFGAKEWIHHMGTPSNTIQGMENLFNRNLNSFELDVFFNADLGKFLVTHDWPATDKTLFLEEVLVHSRTKKMKLWIDLKNASLTNVFKLASVLKSFEEKYQIKGSYFIESTHVLHQVMLSWLGVDTVLWVMRHDKSRISFIRHWWIRLGIALGNFVAVSFSFETYTPEIANKYQHLNKLIFTVNDPIRRANLLQEPNLKVILKDLSSNE